MKRKKLKSLSTLKKKLWTIFSQYVRMREADENGITSCISCGKRGHWRSFDAGHFVPKSTGLWCYFLEKSVHPQCQKCNLFLQGNQYEYALSLKKKYGEGVIDEIMSQRKEGFKYSRSDYEEMIQYYSDKVKKIAPHTVNEQQTKNNPTRPPNHYSHVFSSLPDHFESPY